MLYLFNENIQSFDHEGRLTSLKAHTFQAVINVPIDNANTPGKGSNGHRCCPEEIVLPSTIMANVPILPLRKNFDYVNAHQCRIKKNGGFINEYGSIQGQYRICTKHIINFNKSS